MIFRKAILIIHGFAGGTYDQEYLANELELENHFDVYTFTLPGHDNTHSKIKMEDWIEKAELQTERLIKNGYKNIYLIGHSMGGVIATHIASKYKEVKKLVLAAPAFHFLSVKNDDLNILESLKSGKQVLKDYKTDVIISRFLKLPANAVTEFIKLVKNYYDTPCFITIPTLIIEGTKDTLVPMSSANYVYKHLQSKQKILLKVDGINHDIFRSNRTEELTRYIIKFLKNKIKYSKELNI